MGTGSMKKEDRDRRLRQWSNLIEGAQSVPRKAQKLTFGVLQQLGVPVQKK